MMEAAAGSKKGKKKKCQKEEGPVPVPVNAGPNQLRQLQAQDVTEPCIFCNLKEVREVEFGPMYSYGAITTHYYCMLFSAALIQHGKDWQGILGFLPKDIDKEARRARRLKCSYCGTFGASVGCNKGRCKVMYHYPCGLANAAQFKFLNRFESYCKDHHESQTITIPKEEWKCPICFEHVEDDEDKVMPSCCNASVFHKECLQQLALSAGYFYKCPLCNSDKPFVREMKSFGIFVPEQDAAWERVPRAFEEMYEAYSRCDSANCACPDGPDFLKEKGPFSLARCVFCGSAAVHLRCGKLKTDKGWKCETCRPIATSKVSNTPSTSAIPIPGSSSAATNDSQVYFSKIKINRKCKAFFPYDKPDLKAFAKQKVTTLPDWRQLTITVNLVDWVGKYMRTVASSTETDASGNNQQMETL